MCLSCVVMYKHIGSALTHRPDCPTMLDYKTHAENESMYNTPPCYAMYVCGLVFEHLLKKGEKRLDERAYHRLLSSSRQTTCQASSD